MGLDRGPQTPGDPWGIDPCGTPEIIEFKDDLAFPP